MGNTATRPPQKKFYFKNDTQEPLVVFLERGVLYCKQKLEPGEAVAITRAQAGYLPFSICCSVGTELPTVQKSFDNFWNVSKEWVVPALTGVAAVTATLASGGTAPPAATGSGRACAEVLESFVSDNPQNFSFRQPNFGADIASKKDELFAFYGGGAETIQLRELSQIDENVKVLRPIM